MTHGTYLSDVLLDPEQKLALIQQAHVQVPVLAYSVTCEKSPKADPVVEIHHYDFVPRLLHNLGAIPVCVSIRNIPCTRVLAVRTWNLAPLLIEEVAGDDAPKVSVQAKGGKSYRGSAHRLPG